MVLFAFCWFYGFGGGCVDRFWFGHLTLCSRPGCSIWNRVSSTKIWWFVSIWAREALSRNQHCSMYQASADLFCKGPHIKYFRLWGAILFLWTTSSAVVAQNNKRQVTKWMWLFSYKLYHKNWQWVRFDPQAIICQPPAYSNPNEMASKQIKQVTNVMTLGSVENLETLLLK